jgi:hypothetical protein
MSDDRIGDYFQLALQQAPTDITTHLEVYCLSGVTGEHQCVHSKIAFLTGTIGIVQNYKQALIALKAETSSLIIKRLCKSIFILACVFS